MVYYMSFGSYTINALFLRETGSDSQVEEPATVKAIINQVKGSA